MNKKAVERITRSVVEQFPEMEGVHPTVKPEKDQFVVTYKGAAELPNGKSMKRIVRVVADENGAVVRMSTSR